MVRLRLRRKGRIHKPIYDIVAVDIRKKRDGGYIEKVGLYDPNQSPSLININADKAVKWLQYGAQPTDRVRLLLSYEGVLLRRHMKLKGKSEEEIAEAVEKHKENAAARYTRRKEARKAVPEVEEEAPAEEEVAEAPAEETAEAPAEEETAESPAEEAPAAEETAEEAPAAEAKDEE